MEKQNMQWLGVGFYNKTQLYALSLTLDETQGKYKGSTVHHFR